MAERDRGAGAEPDTVPAWRPAVPRSGPAAHRRAIGLAVALLALAAGFGWGILLVDALGGLTGWRGGSALFEWVQSVRGEVRGRGFVVYPDRDRDLIFAGLVVGVILAIVLPLGLLDLANRFLVPAYAEVRAHDSRAPVLYLRPFAEDSAATTETVSGGDVVYVERVSTDRHLEALDAIGPLVAVARPGWLARLGLYPDSGPYTVYVAGDRWQQDVEALLHAAQRVVIVLGESAGIEWELRTARAHVAPEALLLYLPPRDLEGWTRASTARKQATRLGEQRALVERMLGCQLPALPPGLLIVGFDRDWTPVLPTIASIPPRWWWTKNDRIRAQVSEQLRQVAGRGTRPAEWVAPPRPDRRARVGRWAALAGVVAAGAISRLLW